MLCLGEVPPISVHNVQLPITTVLQWLWLRKQFELLKLKSLRFAA